MKKIFLLHSLGLLLPFAFSLGAFGAELPNSINDKNNFQEIILNANEGGFDQNNSISLADVSLPKNTTIADTSAVTCNCAESSKKEIRVFSRLNPFGIIKDTEKVVGTGGAKIEKALDTGVGKINEKVDSRLDNLGGTPFAGFKKIDSAVDSGAVHLNGAVGTVVKGISRATYKGTEKLYDAVDVGLGGMDKVLNTGIDKTTVQEWMDGDNAARKCFGARPMLESHGVTIDSSLLYSPFYKTRGGANEDRSGKGYSLFNLGVTLDTEGAGLWKGGKFFMLYQKKTGYGISGPNGAMGDYMGFDGWDWRQLNQISEYWYEQTLFDGKLRMKFGKQDSNTDFGYLNSGWDFMNSGFSVNPTTPLPTYPDSQFGFMAEINPKEWLSIRNGIYSRYNVPFNITEVEVKPMIKHLPGRYMVGAWEMSDSTGMGVATGVDADGEVLYNEFNRNFGCYCGFEQMVYKENKKDENDMQGLVVFGQFGMSPSNKNDVNRYCGAGLHYQGPIPKRDKDIAGIAVGSGNFAPRLGDITSQVGSETVVEAFYRVHVNKWFYLQPDVQFIMNPSGTYGNSVAIGLRSVITF